ncbi:hypothetical protein ACJMK2_015183 [Sinanodonta woodiana]|uniref:Uncharacterized protein n=1 Tax=Sinanodonta woodiana TaxID=1069815 RepID=A0ABD3V457_SINWO
MLKKANIRVDLRSSLSRMLKLGNAIIDHLGKNDNFTPRKNINRHTSSAVRAMPDVLQKYRCITQVRKELGISRSKVKNMTCIKVHHSVQSKFGKKVRIFLEREDNSTILPGKRDTEVQNKTPMPKIFLNDNLHNLQFAIVTVAEWMS